MQKIITDIYQPKDRLMTVLRYILILLVVFLGLARLRFILLILNLPEFFKSRDILEIYLMAKALLAGMNPYMPLDQLSQLFIGANLYYPHPSPYPPFVAIIAIPLSLFSADRFFIVWFVFEVICLTAIAFMLTVLLYGRVNRIKGVVLFFILLAFYPVMADLTQGQFSLLLTAMILGSLIALKKNSSILAGILIGASCAIKLITWPLFIYLIIKKDWRTVISGSLTFLGLNLIAFSFMGLKPFLDYYLHISAGVFNIYKGVMNNLSIWAIGYRFFEGMDAAIFSDYLKAPPLLYLPQIAPLVSAGLAITYLMVGIIWSFRSKDIETAFAIMMCVIVAVSPVSWDHYYVLIIFSIVIMYTNLSKDSFPAWQTAIYSLILVSFFLLNEHIGNIINQLNGGAQWVRDHGYNITFISSLLLWLPLLELIILTFLLWRNNEYRKKRIEIKEST